jgi:ABC-type sugar transport system ATPase subunit
MADIRFSQVRKVFDNGVVALESFSLHVPSPRLVVLVGPSGCGKTTLLRLIAGLERPTEGTIMLGQHRLDTLDPRRRDVAMVFQNYALYPHMTVRENLSFGLRIRKEPRTAIGEKVQKVSESLEIDGLLDRKPAQLSGGQRQRVALGRAIIREPQVFLFDEPLSNLDARLRDEMRYLIKGLYERLATTTVYVTHDQVEAMTIGEMLVVLKDGRIHQVGSPSECYGHPKDTFVASFLGSPPMNLLDTKYDSGARSLVLENGDSYALPPQVSEAIDKDGTRDVVIGARPENIEAAGGGGPAGGAPEAASTGGAEGGAGAWLTLTGRVVLSETLGHELLTHVDVGEQKIILRSTEPPCAETEGPRSFQVPDKALHYFSGASGRRIETGVPQ